jgi:hypothetical protein
MNMRSLTYILIVCTTILDPHNIFDEGQEMLSFVWGNNSYGDPTPIFGLCTTNSVEGGNNALLYNDF